MALRCIVSLLALSAAPAVQSLTCNHGQTQTEIGSNCSGYATYDSWVRLACIGANDADRCFSASYSFEWSPGCWMEAVTGSCALNVGDQDACTYEQTYLDLYASHLAIDFSCSTCATDTCNSMSFAIAETTTLGRGRGASGGTRVKVALAGMLGIVAAAVAWL